MLSKKERLSRGEFNRFFSMGKRYQSPALTLIFHPSEEFHGSVVVSKKIAKTAVARNTFRRRVYDILRNHARSETLSGIFILIAKSDAARLSYDHLRKEISALVGRTRLSR